MFVFVFNDTATTEIYTLSLHDALPIFRPLYVGGHGARRRAGRRRPPRPGRDRGAPRRPLGRAPSRARVAAPLRVSALSRSEEHTSELQSRQYLVCRLLLEKKKHTNLLS